MTTRRGFTLMECLISIAILAVMLSVALRLLFASDVALGRDRKASANTGALARLMTDFAADVRPASSASAGGSSLSVGGASYSWDRSRNSIVRRAGGDVRAYPGVRATFSARGNTVVLDATSGKTAVRTSCYMRR